MLKSDGIEPLAKALVAAQAEIGAAKKEKTNPHFKSTYADLSSVIDAVRDPLAKHDLAFLQATIQSDREEAVVETVIMHSSGAWISAFTAVPVSKQDAQGFGSALTYAKRYGLQSILGVASEDDDGNSATESAPYKKLVDGARELIKSGKVGDACDKLKEAGLSDSHRKSVLAMFTTQEREVIAAEFNKRKTDA